VLMISVSPLVFLFLLLNGELATVNASETHKAIPTSSKTEEKDESIWDEKGVTKSSRVSIILPHFKLVLGILVVLGIVNLGIAIGMGFSEGKVAGWNEGNLKTRMTISFRYIDMTGYLMTMCLLFAPFVVKMIMVRKTEEQLKNSLMYQTAKDSLEWTDTIITFLLFLAAVFDFIGYEAECEDLVDDSGKPIVGLYSYKLSGPYPAIPRALTWSCVSTECLLVCEKGYKPVNAITQCKQKGGKGLGWSHLSGFSDASRDPTCCIDNNNAPALANANITEIVNTPGSIQYNATYNNRIEYFSSTCGDDQEILLQACDVTSTASTLQLWQMAASCTHKCNLLNSTSSDCLITESKTLNGLSDKDLPQGKGFTGIEFESFESSFVATKKYIFRMIYKTSTVSVTGPWKQSS